MDHREEHLQFALNQMTVPSLGFAEFLDLAARLGCCGVEIRNDLGKPIFDGLPAFTAGKMAQDHGLSIFGLSQVYPFTDWTAARKADTETLIGLAQEVGAQAVGFIPGHGGPPIDHEQMSDRVETALSEISMLLDGSGISGLIEPLGFATADLQTKRAALEAIHAVEGSHVFKLIHDSFHHTLAGEAEFFSQQTGLVHLSGVTRSVNDPQDHTDLDRGLVDAGDRLGNIDQIRALQAQGYQGAFSLECFAPEVHTHVSLFEALTNSMKFMSLRTLEE